jgi:two-component system, NarL family, nitrate/nitrite response regulator NarL
MKGSNNGSGAPSTDLRLRVLLVDEDRGGIGALLRADPGLVLETAPSLPAAERLASRVRPQVLVVALAEASLEHAAALRSFRTQCEGIPVLIVSSPAPERVVTSLIKAGAGGYLFSNEARHVVSAIRELVRGGAPMSLPVSHIVLGRARRSSTQMAAVQPATSASTVRLTARQRQILEFLAGGHSYEDIGLALDLSVNTVRSHVKALYDRLGASTKVEAVMIGMELRLFNESGDERDPSS